jgi:thymidylate synthase ThyX
MNVRHVSIQPTEQAIQANRFSLTPELLAATGARYSRSDEGLEAIASKIDKKNLDKSVDSIFKMIDYGHQSIADMVPVPIFMDRVSLWLIYHVWSLCPTGGGQESSTRYITYSTSGLVEDEFLNWTDSEKSEWKIFMDKCFKAYDEASTIWQKISEDFPEAMMIPRSLIDSTKESDQKKVARMRRNFVFDRARYFLPNAVLSNFMLIMSARGWVSLAQQLHSHPMLEAQKLAELIKEELALVAPRMIKHAVAKDSLVEGLKQEFSRLQTFAKKITKDYLSPEAKEYTHPDTAHLETFVPQDVNEGQFVEDLKFHDNRYAWIGSGLQRTGVRFSWDAVSIAELRDLNRHRTGTKNCISVPVGFYYAEDQITDKMPQEYRKRLKELANIGREAAYIAKQKLIDGDPAYIYWTTIGAQFPFEHTTTADKFIYEAELRTGTGAHYRNAKHLRDTLQLWYEKFPKTKGLILEGSAEPE